MADRYSRYDIGNEQSVWVCPTCEPPAGAEWLEDAKYWYDDPCAICDRAPDEDEGEPDADEPDEDAAA